MSAWAVVGAARGIGFEFVNQLSSDSAKTVFALIRSQKTADSLRQLSATRPNIHILEANTASTKSMRATADEVGKLTGGKLDGLIYNAYSVGTGEGANLTPSGFTDKDAELEEELISTLQTNCIQVAYAVNAFLPLLRQGQEKKVVYITSAAGDIEFTRHTEMPTMLGYCISKAAGNLLMAKYAAELKADGIVTLSLSPGWVATDAAKGIMSIPEVFDYFLSSFRKVSPEVNGMNTPEESVKAQLAVIADMDADKSGAFLSQHGNNTEWL